jgi:hypothetical protein
MQRCQLGGMTLPLLGLWQGDKYLGLLALVGADRSDCFCHLIDRVVIRINGWR